MAINLNKHKDELTNAYKDVISEKTDTDWALFGYEGQTNDLKVVNTGSGGLEELTEDLNSGKIMYAFVKINDPKTSLPKCVLIIWQGDGANTVRKGLCANHIRDVEKFFNGAITINARNEEEVEPQLIIDKIANAGSAYSFKAPRSDNSGPKVPVGSNYKRVNPLQEINATERDQFWYKEEQEEKRRVEEERRRRDEERKILDEEIKKRDELEAKRREEITKKRDSTIDQIKEAELKQAANVESKQDTQNNVAEREVKVNQSDMIRQQRNAETQNLIAQRTIDARSIFEKNTSAGQIKRTPEKPVRTSLLKAQQEKQMQQQQQQQQLPAQPELEEQYDPNTTSTEVDSTNIVRHDEQQSDDESDQFATIKRCPKDNKQNSVTSPTEPDNDIQMQENNKVVEEVQQISEQQFVDAVIYGDAGIRARAIYDYAAADDTEITIDPGDIISHIEMVDDGWWQGLGPDGNYGLFPANYVELI
ncbi:drebrin-like protein [Atheta coriaria]|uniref:drebrin-like protein n=1 Tax=Dalotia coriaria TaxID=877792 RepID=UPI0031F370D7